MGKPYKRYPGEIGIAGAIVASLILWAFIVYVIYRLWGVVF